MPAPPPSSPATPPARVLLEPDGVRLDLRPGQTVLAASLAAGVPHAHACGGLAQCSTCRVVVTDGLDRLSARTPAEAALADRLGFSPEVRLACQARLLAGPPTTRPVALRRSVLDETDVDLAASEARGDRAAMAGRAADATVLFADLAGYTPFAAARPAYDVVHVLQRYYARMGDIVAGLDGRIVDYNGDEFVAVFEDRALPSGYAHPVRGALASLAVLEAVEDFNGYLARSFDARFAVRIGVHTGALVVGCLGTRGSEREVVVGDVVNTAARVEQANKALGTQVLVSDALYRLTAHALDYRTTCEVEIKGKPGLHRLHEPTGARLS